MTTQVYLKGWNLTVKKATPKSLLLPKEKHVRKAIRGNTGKHPIGELFDALSKRMSTCKDSTSHLKCLYIIHRCMRESSSEFINQLKYRVHLLQLAETATPSPLLGSQPLLFMRAYAFYLKEKVEAYRALKVEVERNPEHCKSLPTDTLIKALPFLQNQLSALVAMTKFTPLAQYSCPLILGCFELVLKDSFRLYSGYNIGVIQLLDHYFTLPLAQAQRALNIYTAFVELTSLTNDFFQSCLIFARDLPKLSTPSGELADSLEAYIVSKGGVVDRSTASRRQHTADAASPKQAVPPPRAHVPSAAPVGASSGSSPKLPGHLVRRSTTDAVARGASSSSSSSPPPPSSSSSSSSSSTPSPSVALAQLVSVDLSSATPSFFAPAEQISQISQEEYLLQQRLEQQRQDYERTQQHIAEEERRLQQLAEAKRAEQQRAHQIQLAQIQQQLQQQQQMLEQQLLEQQRAERAQFEEHLQRDQARIEQVRQEQQRQHQQTLEQHRLEQQRIEQQKIMLEQQRLEQQRLEQQRLEQQRLEQQRLEQQRLEQQRLEQQRLEQQRVQQEMLRQQQLLQMQQAQQQPIFSSFAQPPTMGSPILGSSAGLAPVTFPATFSSGSFAPGSPTPSLGSLPSVAGASFASSSALPAAHPFGLPAAAPPTTDLFAGFTPFPQPDMARAGPFVPQI